MKHKMRRWLRRSIPYIIGFLAGTFMIDRWVWYSARSQMYSSVAEIPHRKVGLLLGTSKYLRGHRFNRFYQYRIDAAVALFRAGKIDYILVSGDNRKEAYNEPQMMRADLLRAGIPPGRIVADYAGFRTLDSILRCRDVFGESRITIISQPFHNARALFIAGRKGMQAVAFNAQDSDTPYWLWGFFRERLARVKVVIDLMVGKEPAFYGPRVTIG